MPLKTLRSPTIFPRKSAGIGERLRGTGAGAAGAVRRSPGGRVQVRPGQGERRRRLRIRPPSDRRRGGPDAGQGRGRAPRSSRATRPRGSPGSAILASLKRELSELDRVTGWVKALGLVNCSPGFSKMPAVINGFSELILELWGEAGEGRAPTRRSAPRSSPSTSRWRSKRSSRCGSTPAMPAGSGQATRSTSSAGAALNLRPEVAAVAEQREEGWGRIVKSAASVRAVQHPGIGIETSTRSSIPGQRRQQDWGSVPRLATKRAEPTKSRGAGANDRRTVSV